MNRTLLAIRRFFLLCGCPLLLCSCEEQEALGQSNPVPFSAASPYGPELAKYNTVVFKPITTSGIGMKIKLQKGVYAGILRWKVL